MTSRLWSKRVDLVKYFLLDFLLTFEFTSECCKDGLVQKKQEVILYMCKAFLLCSNIEATFFPVNMSNKRICVIMVLFHWKVYN